VASQATLIRPASPGLYSLTFEAIEPKEQERLIRFVFATLRAAAGKTS
jgi:c-di-GMP-binding flagellar brake protein YcgR